MARIHILLDEEDKSRYRRQAELEGKSLGAWLREAAEEKYGEALEQRPFGDVDELRRFFESCDARETEPEPDWEGHRRVIARSRVEGTEES